MHIQNLTNNQFLLDGNVITASNSVINITVKSFDNVKIEGFKTVEINNNQLKTVRRLKFL